MHLPTGTTGARRRPATGRDAGTHRARRGPLVLTAALLAALAPAASPAAGAAPPGGTPDAPTPSAATASGRYYVVGPPVGGQREYLYQIAAGTLGDGNRYREIFVLNQGRRQPDGGRLTDPVELRPGWVLALPLDARGPGVRTGPLPTGGAVGAPPAADEPGHPERLVGVAGLAAVALLVATLLRRPARRRRALPAGATRLALDVGCPAPLLPPTPVPPPPVPAPLVPARLVPPTPVPPPPAAGTDGDLDTEVTSAVGTLAVRLPTVASGGGPAYHVWQLPAQPPPPMRLPVRLGRRRGWALWVDLAGTPDVLTVTGPAGAAGQQARTIAERVHAAGHTVTVVGDLFGADLPAGWVHRSVFPADVADLPAGPGVLCSAALSGPELAFARQITTLTGHQLVPVVVGRAMRARWSVTVRPATGGPDAELVDAAAPGGGFPGDGGEP
ncbi:hypothetical protein [Micromonospora rifamycinica]|uniref:LysM domain-containing protein n=2 Tax=Micromonospora rifamycinica TaxID=291594 RepID=A0A1C5HKR3_9ACTN|nr:hypothetical protein [Micromonospora rifamycinica]SCG46604.1 hypothetical protein GA0070623_1383 [Micromonospora rifamycinica]